MKKQKANNVSSEFEIIEELLGQLLKNYHKSEHLLGSESIIKQLTKRAIERIMDGEMDYPLDEEKNPESDKDNDNFNAQQRHLFER